MHTFNPLIVVFKILLLKIVQKPYLYIGLVFFASMGNADAQSQDSLLMHPKVQDSAVSKVATKVVADTPIVTFMTPHIVDTTAVKKHNPKTATIRSLILPGWGQWYNKQYWKVPLAVGAVSIPIFTYIFYNKQRKIANDAYNIAFTASAAGGATKSISAVIAELKAKGSKYQNYYDAMVALYASSASTAVTQYLSNVQNWRNSYRRYVDYSVLWEIILWGVNVADATVSGHLKDFNVSTDLSMKIRPTYFPIAHTPGLSFIFTLK